MLAGIGGVVLVIVGIILAINAINESNGRSAAEQGPTGQEYWEQRIQEFGPDGGPQGYGGPRRPDEYNPEAYGGGAVVCFILAIILFAIAA